MQNEDPHFQQIQQFQYNHQNINFQENKQISIVKKNIPKANQIVLTAKENKNSLYAFKIDTQVIPQISQQNETLIHNKNNLKHNGKTQKRQFLVEIFQKQKLIYDRYSLGIRQFSNSTIYSLDKLKKMRKNQIPLSFFKDQTKPFIKDDFLIFDSRFQSGNLSFVSKSIQSQYNLLLQNDINTKGYNNWFYFKVINKSKGKFKFNILNYGKAGWLYNQGMGIATFSKINYKQKQLGWFRSHNQLECYRNNISFQETDQQNNYSTLSWTYQFTNLNDEVYFAYSIPYTYTDQCTHLDQIQLKRLPYFHRKLLGKSLAGNRLEILTINQSQKNINVDTEKGAQKPVIIIISRLHPGETVSSWILKGLIQFLINNSKQAQQLREKFIFKIIPMLNPDGVIHGNYRCSLSGRDLNRRWIKPDRHIFPQVYFAKKAINQISVRKNIELFLDLHGHGRKKKMFIYGCSDKFNPIKCRQFPYLLSKINSNFQYRSCNFMIQKYKQTTARVTVFRKLNISTIFTLESSICGNQNIHFSISALKQMGQSISKSILIYFSNSHKNKTNNQNSNIKQNILYELHQNRQLLNIGNQVDFGSESQPSIDNIPISEINKISLSISKKKSHNSKQKKIKHFSLRKQSLQILSKTNVIVSQNASLISKDSFTTTIVKKQNEIYFERKEYKTPQKKQIKTITARRNRISRQKNQSSQKNIISHRKYSKQIKFINFPLVFCPLQQTKTTYNFFNQQKCDISTRHTHSINQPLKSQQQQQSDNISYKLRNFLRASAKKRSLIKN